MNNLDLEAINSRSPYDVHSMADQYVFVTDTGIEYHVALIIQRTNPLLDEIIARFDSEIAMFNEYKP